MFYNRIGSLFILIQFGTNYTSENIHWIKYAYEKREMKAFTKVRRYF